MHAGTLFASTDRTIQRYINTVSDEGENATVPGYHARGRAFSNMGTDRLKQARHERDWRFSFAQH